MTFSNTGTIILLSQCLWSNAKNMVHINNYLNTTKHKIVYNSLGVLYYIR